MFADLAEISSFGLELAHTILGAWVLSIAGVVIFSLVRWKNKTWRN